MAKRLLARLALCRLKGIPLLLFLFRTLQLILFFSAIDHDGETSTNGGFSAASLSLRMQKKLAGKVASREVAKHYLSEPVFRLLDALHDLLKEFYPKKTADKASSPSSSHVLVLQVVKGIVKLALKLAIVARSGALEGSDGSKQLARLQRTLHSFALTFVSFAQVRFVEEEKKLKVAYSYERSFLMESATNIRSLLEPLVSVHLSEKSSKVSLSPSSSSSSQRLDFIFSHLENKDMFDVLFKVSFLFSSTRIS